MPEQGADRLRVMYVAPAYPALSETFVRREVEGLRSGGEEGGVEVVVMGLRESDRPGAEGVVYGRGFARRFLVELARRPLRSVGTLTRGLADAIWPGETMRLNERLKLLPQAAAGVVLGGEIRSRGVEHVHAHFAHAPTTVAMYGARQAGVGFSFTGHANDIFQRRSLLRRKLRRCEWVSCISRWHSEWYRGIEETGRRVVVRCGVEVRGGEKARAGARRRNAGAGQGMRVLTVARLVEKKGVDAVVEAVMRLGARQPGWELIVAGDGPERSRLESMASGKGGGGDAGHGGRRIRFLGAVENERVKDLLDWADVFVLPCREDRSGDRDGIPVVLMEAMAAGVPVVSGDLPAIRELVDPARDGGVLVRAGSARDVMDVLAGLSDDDARYERLSWGGLARVEEEFSLEQNVGRIRTEFRRVIGAKRSEPTRGGSKAEGSGRRKGEQRIQ